MLLQMVSQGSMRFWGSLCMLSVGDVHWPVHPKVHGFFISTLFPRSNVQIWLHCGWTCANAWFCNSKDGPDKWQMALARLIDVTISILFHK